MELTKQELENIIKETKNSLHLEEDDDSGNENDDKVELEPEPEPGSQAANDEFDLENYDDEEG